LSEEDRLHGDLEEPAIRFIRQTTRELIEELGFRDNPDAEPQPIEGAAYSRPIRVMCVPVRDEVDELGAMMLCQSLIGGRIQAFSSPVRRIDEVIASAAAERPDIVFLCGLPPFGISRSHRLYRSLRARNPHLKIMVGIWNYPSDPIEAGQKISGGENIRVMTRLSEAIAEVRTFAAPPQRSLASPENAIPVNATPDQQREYPRPLATVSDESAA
jgi:hypothetical protein